MKFVQSLKLAIQLVLVSGAIAAQAQDRFPQGPNDHMTPGSLCATPTEYRYPEHIPYCARSVDPAEKQDIIREYDSEFGYSIGRMNRGDFKIDHLIPLCAGGSNERNNLWPQHRSVYVQTDRIEETVCMLMARGKMSQAQAVHTVLDVKHNLSTAPAVLRSLLQQLD